MSRIGNKSITVPADVKVKLEGSNVSIAGKKGDLNFTLPAGININIEAEELSFTRINDQKKYKSLHGTVRSIIANMVKGVTEGFEKKLQIVGVGFNAKLAGKNLVLSLGKSHLINHPIPAGLDVKVEENTKLTVAGIDKQLVGQFAAEVRNYYPPEPYKGKGVQYVGEYIRRKAAKSVK